MAGKDGLLVAAEKISKIVSSKSYKGLKEKIQFALIHCISRIPYLGSPTGKLLRSADFVEDDSPHAKIDCLLYRQDEPVRFDYFFVTKKLTMSNNTDDSFVPTMNMYFSENLHGWFKPKEAAKTWEIPLESILHYYNYRI